MRKKQSRLVKRVLKVFDAQTEAKRDEFAARAKELTPAEKELAEIKARRDAEDRRST
jgi:hypothetical protein